MAIPAAAATGRPGDWTCPSCQSNVFASKVECFRCRAPKPGHESGFGGGQAAVRGHGMGRGRGSTTPAWMVTAAAAASTTEAKKEPEKAAGAKAEEAAAGAKEEEPAKAAAADEELTKAAAPELWPIGQQLLFEDRASGSTVEVTLVVVDRTALPAEQEAERGYTVRLPDGRERNTLRARLRLPDKVVAAAAAGSSGGGEGEELAEGWVAVPDPEVPGEFYYWNQATDETVPACLPTSFAITHIHTTPTTTSLRLATRL